MDFSAADQTRGFHHFAGSVAFNGRLGVFDFAYDDGGQLDRNRVTFVESYFACKEYEIAKQTNEQKTVKFIIKAGVKIDTSMRIIFQKAVYDIDNVDNIGFKNELIEVKAIERSLQRNEN